MTSQRTREMNRLSISLPKEKQSQDLSRVENSIPMDFLSVIILQGWYGKRGTGTTDTGA